MPNGRSANVRSHRRGGGGRRRISPWLVIGLVVVVALSGVTVSWTYLVHKGCTGMDKATIDASPNIAPILNSLEEQWAKTSPAVLGTCVSVSVNAKDSALMATALGSPWNTQANGAAPDVWVPESSVWVRQASVSNVAQQLMPDLQPSLARSPNVIAMPKNLAVALGWPNTKFDWPDILKDQANANFWGGHGQPAAPFKFTMTSPETSTAGMLALMSIADEGNDGSITTTDESYVYQFAQQEQNQVGDTSDILDALATPDGQSVAAVDKYISGFPALEQDVIQYNEKDPKEPLVSVYPTSGSYDADHPYLILSNPSWGSKAAVTAATAFEAYARGPVGRATFLKSGFRDSNRDGDSAFVPSNGVLASLNAYLPRAVLVPDSVNDTMQAWTAQTRATNVLIVLDVSGSMVDLVRGTQKTRLQYAQAAALKAVNEFSADSSVGLWVFATNLDGKRDYKQLVPIGQLEETMSDGKSRKDDLRKALAGLQAGGNTGLYNTIDAAQKEVVANFKSNATNLVVLMTDGKDDPDPGTTSEVDLTQLELDLTKNNASTKPVPVVTIGLGPDVDNKRLSEISRVSGAISLTSESGFDINQVLLSALFGVATAG